MPKWLEDKLYRQGRKKGLKGKRLKKYVFGTMNKIESRNSVITKLKGGSNA